MPREALEGAPDPAEFEALQDELTRERAARQADQSALAALRDDLAAERAALAEVREQLESLRADIESGREATREELAAELRAEMESAREADRAVLAALRADLNAERAAREADQAELARLRARVAETEREGGLLDRVAELDRRAAGLADELELQRRAREQAEAAAAAVRDDATRTPGRWSPTSTPPRRQCATASPTASPRRRRPKRPSWSPCPPTRPSWRPMTPRTATRRMPRSLPPRRLPSGGRSSRRSSGPARAHATGRSQRQYPWLRGALVKLAHDDPKAAGKLIAGLLPVQAVIVQGPVDYDLTIAEVGTFAVTVAGGRAYVKEIDAPRGRSEAEFHLTAEALTLAELIAGVPHKVGRFRGADPGHRPQAPPQAAPRHPRRPALARRGRSRRRAARAGARLPHVPLRHPGRLVARPPVHRRPERSPRPPGT